MRKVEIEIPDGKMAQWVNGVLTLVDEKPQNVMERIKTFEDAVTELSYRVMIGDKDAEKLLDEWKISSQIGSKDLLAYLKLRIITYALNEGWKPEFEEAIEPRCYPWFNLQTSREVGRGGIHVNEVCSLVYAYKVDEYLYSLSSHGSRLAFKSRELAEYAGKQFVEIYEEYCLI